MDELEILQSLQKQMDRLMLEPLSPAEESLRNAVAILIAIALRKFA